MSNYSTLAKVRDAAGFANNTNIPDAKIQQFQDAATSDINIAIGKRYTLPLASTPEFLKQIEEQLAAGHLLLDEYGAQAEGTGKDGQKKVDWAEGKLKDIVSGVVQLVDAAGVNIAGSSQTTLSGLPDSSTDPTTEALNDDNSIFKIGERQW